MQQHHEIKAQQQHPQPPPPQQAIVERPREPPHLQKQPVATIAGPEVQQVIPLVVAQNDGSGAVQHHHQTAFLVTSVPSHQIIQSGNIMQAQNVAAHAPANNAFTYQLADTGYVINEQGNIVNTMVNAQHHTPYTFTRM